MCYGRIAKHHPDGRVEELGTFPPTYGQFNLQSAIYHAGLTFWRMQLSDALFDAPADWSMCRRMLGAGVRMGMLDEVVVDWYA